MGEKGCKRCKRLQSLQAEYLETVRSGARLAAENAALRERVQELEKALVAPPPDKP